MPKVDYTAEAERDLAAIVDRIALDDVQAAEAWLRDTRSLCELLASQPGMGQRIDSRRFVNVRRHVAGNYLIYYEPTAQGIDVVRIVHGAREQGKLIQLLRLDEKWHRHSPISPFESARSGSAA